MVCEVGEATTPEAEGEEVRKQRIFTKTFTSVNDK
jgi:hypothetical protein